MIYLSCTVPKFKYYAVPMLSLLQSSQVPLWQLRYHSTSREGEYRLHHLLLMLDSWHTNYCLYHKEWRLFSLQPYAGLPPNCKGSKQEWGNTLPVDRICTWDFWASVKCYTYTWPQNTIVGKQKPLLQGAMLGQTQKCKAVFVLGWSWAANVLQRDLCMELCFECSLECILLCCCEIKPVMQIPWVPRKHSMLIAHRQICAEQAMHNVCVFVHTMPQYTTPHHARFVCKSLYYLSLSSCKSKQNCSYPPLLWLHLCTHTHTHTHIVLSG